MKIELLQKLLGENLICVCTFERNTRTIIVLDSINVDVINSLQPYIDRKNPPVLMRRRDVERGRDVFALDYLHIVTDYALLYGTDIFKNIRITKADVRRNLEHELRSRLMALYTRIAVSASKKEKQAILEYTPSTLFPILKGLVYLKEITVEKDAEQLLEQFASAYKKDCSVVKNIFKKKANLSDIQPLLAWITDICDAVDRMVA